MPLADRYAFRVAITRVPSQTWLSQFGLNPARPNFSLRAGTRSMVDGHPDEAIADFSAALVLDPKSADVCSWVTSGVASS